MPKYVFYVVLVILLIGLLYSVIVSSLYLRTPAPVINSVIDGTTDGSFKSLKSTGDISGKNITALGAVSGSRFNTDGDVSANNLKASGDITGNNITGATVTSNGDIVGNNMTASGILSGSKLNTSGDVTSNNVLTTNVSASGNIIGKTVQSTGNLYGDSLNSNNAIIAKTLNVNNGQTGAALDLGGDYYTGNFLRISKTGVNSWSSGTAYNNARYITTDSKLENHQPFNVGAGGVGIGYNPPTYDRGARDALYAKGNVGINTNAPAQPLDVVGNARATSMWSKNFCDANGNYCADPYSLGVLQHATRTFRGNNGTVSGDQYCDGSWENTIIGDKKATCLMSIDASTGLVIPCSTVPTSDGKGIRTVINTCFGGKGL